MSILSPVGVLYFPNLFEPKANRSNPAQAPRYSCVLLFDKTGVQSTAYANLRQGVMETIAAKWGEAKAKDASFVRGLRLPFRNAADKAGQYNGFEDGEIYISPWSHGNQEAPGILDLRGQKILVPADVWSGQLARATIHPFAYDNNGNRGVSFGLEHVQIVKSDMPRRDNRQSAEQAFANAPDDDEQMRALGLSGAGAGADSTAAADDLPF